MGHFSTDQWICSANHSAAPGSNPMNTIHENFMLYTQLQCKKDENKRKGLGLAHINNNPAEFMICHKLVQQYQFDCQSVHRYLWQVAQK